MGDPFDELFGEKVTGPALRELTEEELGLLEGRAVMGIGTPSVKKLRYSHHELARLLAEGKRPVEVAEMTGYSQVRISILQSDPAFRELMAHYAEVKEKQFADAQARLAMLGMDAIQELHERLETEPDKFTNSQLLALVETTLDRSVAPKKGGSTPAGGAVDANSLPVVQIVFQNSPSASLPQPQAGVQIEGIVE